MFMMRGCLRLIDFWVEVRFENFEPQMNADERGFYETGLDGLTGLGGTGLDDD